MLPHSFIDRGSLHTAINKSQHILLKHQTEKDLPFPATPTERVQSHPRCLRGAVGTMFLQWGGDMHYFLLIHNTTRILDSHHTTMLPQFHSHVFNHSQHNQNIYITKSTYLNHCRTLITLRQIQRHRHFTINSSHTSHKRDSHQRILKDATKQLDQTHVKTSEYNPHM